MSDGLLASVTRRFWRYADDLRLGAESQVFASRKPIHVSRVVDVDGGQVFEGAPDLEAFLFWIDEAPDANWSHPCRYVLVTEGMIASAMREWPPVEDLYDKLEKIERPR